MKKAIFFGSTTGTTNEVAYILSDILECSNVYNIAETGIKDIINYDMIFILTPTYGRGDLQDDWQEYISELESLNLENKYVALLGVGDIIVHGDSFVNTLKPMYDVIKKTNAKIVGMVECSKYDYLESTAVINEYFLGLPIDHLNEYDLTEDRINNWLKKIENEVK